MAKHYVKKEGSCYRPLRTSSPDGEGDTMEDWSEARMERSKRGASGLVVTLAPGCAFPTYVLGRRQSRPVFISNKISKPKGTEYVVTQGSDLGARTGFGGDPQEHRG